MAIKCLTLRVLNTQHSYYVLSLDPLAGSALEGLGVVDGGAEFALNRDGPPLPEIGEGLLDAHPRGAYEGREIALGGAL